MVDTKQVLSELGQSGAALILLVILGVVALLAIRRRLVSANAKAAERAEEQSARRLQSAFAALPPPPEQAKRRVNLALIHELVPSFTRQAFATSARDLFRTVQLRRLDPPLADLEAQILGGPLEIALNTGPGLEEVRGVEVTRLDFLKAGGTADGCEISVYLTAIVEEVRNGQLALVDVAETWTFGWPPAHGRWRVTRVQRHWRTILQAPVPNPDAPLPGTRPEPDSFLEVSLRDHPVNATPLFDFARLAAEVWAEAVREESPGRLEGLASDAFREATAGLIRRHRHFGHHLHWSLAVESAEIARVIDDTSEALVTVWLRGSATYRLDGPDDSEGTPFELPWARYLDFRELGGGSWLLDGETDDERWDP